ncbi:MAG: DinB family protein [Acidobacteria bacterium]|nr:MAG: DinB family protein [Acidobacteriota bacterium]REJ99121.1 MAG: DinB family protein [Acidobacteriota bacterium]REK16158.1 MAG: DinB family protein [Acidobacteriota bacterium]REK43839.1 MAG: DinB family protein [Acidobacteriota bacterium]
METVLHSFSYTLEFIREQVADVPEQQMIAQPEGVRNHPLWTIGHIAFACEMLGSVIGVEEWLPPCWGGRFGFGSVPSTDPSMNAPKAEALTMLKEAETRISNAVRYLDSKMLDQPFPEESYIKVFPTIRHAITQVLIGHTAYHSGQIGVWRSAMGLQPMRRSYE